MTAIEIPSSVETIGERIFRRCTGLVNVTFEKGSRLTSITGDCVKDSGNRVTSYGAFLECTSLTKIEIPASVTRKYLQPIVTQYLVCNKSEIWP